MTQAPPLYAILQTLETSGKATLPQAHARRSVAWPYVPSLIPGLQYTQENQVVYLFFVKPAAARTNRGRLSWQPIQQVRPCKFCQLRFHAQATNIKCCVCQYREAVLEFLLAKSGALVDDQAQVVPHHYLLSCFDVIASTHLSSMQHRYINQQRVSKFGYEHLQSSRYAMPDFLLLMLRCTDMIPSTYDSAVSQDQHQDITPACKVYSNNLANFDDRDVFTLHLCSGTLLSNSAEADGSAPLDAECSAHYVCPITHLSCLRYPFVAISKCGHAFSDRALKQVSLLMACSYSIAMHSLHSGTTHSSLTSRWL